MTWAQAFSEFGKDVIIGICVLVWLYFILRHL